MRESKSLALPLGYTPIAKCYKKTSKYLISTIPIQFLRHGERGIRTPEPEGADLQSAAFSQTSLPLHKWRGTESNRRHKELQSFALPTELPSQKLYTFQYKLLFGGLKWNRTTDTGIFSPLLYQLSYRAKLREQDLNLRPSGYEPDELPSCSIPR